MLKKILPFALLAAVLAYSALNYGALPGVMATHFGIGGEANGWMDKPYAVLAVPVIGFFVTALLVFLPSFATKSDRRPLAALERELSVLALLLAAFLAFAQYSVIEYNLGRGFAFDAFLWFLAVIIFYAGWMCTRAERNYFVGVRLPWTLADDFVWRKTNDATGWLFMFLAVAFVVTSLFDRNLAFTVFLGGLLASVAFSFFYSFSLSRSKQRGRT